MRILLAVDGSIYTRRMLDDLAAHPKLLGSDPEITALTAAGHRCIGTLQSSGSAHSLKDKFMIALNT